MMWAWPCNWCGQMISSLSCPYCRNSHGGKKR